jgi:hypothetical protein
MTAPMRRFRPPRPERVSDALPPELRWDRRTHGRVVFGLLGRREFLKAVGVTALVASLPLGAPSRAWAKSRGRLFTKKQRETLAALCDRIIPPDTEPGAAALGVVRYIERFLTAFDRRRPKIFAGGPFSNRNPFSDPRDGSILHRRPPNRLKRFIPLSRLQELEWRAELYGSAAVPEVAALDAQFGAPLIGLRDLYTESLQTVDEIAIATKGARFADLDPDAQDEVFDMLDGGAFATDPRRGKTFIDILIENTLEGCFAIPEYGGNAKTRGWAMLGLEGDTHPLGYSLYSEAIDDYLERPDHPMSTPNPDELGPGGTVVPRPLTASGMLIQGNISFLASLIPDDAY